MAVAAIAILVTVAARGRGPRRWASRRRWRCWPRRRGSRSGIGCCCRAARTSTPSRCADPSLETALTAGELLSYREGSTGTVAVRRLAGTVSLAIDGKVDASNAGDMLTQRLLAHVPLLLHPDPKRVAVLGLGSGVTLGSALHASDRATPPCSRSRRRWWRRRGSSRRRIIARSPTRAPALIVGDGRTHLMLGRDTYDVIVSEPSNPWMAGIASLFTREFFEGARARLAPGGVLCQWAHTYDISNADLQIDCRDLPLGVSRGHDVARRRCRRAARRIHRAAG